MKKLLFKIQKLITLILVVCIVLAGVPLFEINVSAATAYAESVAFAEVANELKELFQATWNSYGDSCDISSYGFTTNDLSALKEIFMAARNVGTEYFDVCITYGYDYTSTGLITTIYFDYYSDIAMEFKTGKDALEDVLEEVMYELDPTWSEIEIALYLHDYLALNCEYDYTYSNYSAYDALVGKTAVCSGYATAYWFLASAAGLECGCVTSAALNHAWNIISVNDAWYYVDVTWDDGYGKLGMIGHKYFMKSYEYFHSSSGGHNVDDYWIAGNVSADTISDTTYDNCFWDAVYSGFIYHDGYWYAMSNTANLYRYTCDGVSFSQVKNIYSGSYSFSMGSFDDAIYYIAKSYIYKYDMSTGTTSKVYTIPTGYSYINGMQILTTGEVICELYSDSGKDTCTVMQLSHDITEVPSVAATRTCDGNIQYWKCDTCGRSFSDSSGTNQIYSRDYFIPKIEDITLSATSYTYDGSARKPSVTVTDSNGNTIGSSYYTVSYSNNTDVGTAAATVTFSGNYNGTVTKSFTIKAQTVSSSNVTLSQTSYTYDGNAKKPSVTAVDSAGNTISSSCYTVTYDSGRKKVGTYNVTVEFSGNYSGTVTKTFKIVETVKSSNVTLSKTSYVYNGSARKPTVTAKDSAGNKISSSYYTVTYSNNKNAGTGTVKIKFKGLYSGTVTKTFKITKQAVKKANVTLSTTSYIYNGKVRKPSIKALNSAGNKISSSYYTVTYSNGRKNVGTYTVTIKFKGNYSGTIKKTFTIKPKATDITSMSTSWVSGEPKKSVKLKWSKISSQITGYQIQYSTSKNFTTKTTKTVNKSKTSLTLSQLKLGKKYYIRIRTYKTVSGKKYYSSWSYVWTNSY